MSHRRHLRFVPFTVACALLVATWVVASGPGEPPRRIPYAGRVELGGVPLNGPVSIKFTLHDDADLGSSATTAEETHTVQANDGRFAVMIGSQSTLPEPLFQAADLFVTIEVEGTELGSQRITPAPIAVRAATAYDLAVARDLTVGGSTTVGDLTVQGTLDVSGLSQAQRFEVEGLTTRTTSATRTPGGVLDNDPAATTPYTRVNADSLHTNGLGDGQTWLEGSYIDASTPLYIGEGRAGGRTPSRFVSRKTIQGGEANITGGVPFFTGVTFPVPFDNVPVVVATKSTSDNTSCAPVVDDVKPTGFRLYCLNVDNGQPHSGADPVNWLAFDPTP